MKIYLIRHGVTDWNAKNLVQGQSDIPLNQEGLKQSEKIVQALQEANIGRVLSSHLKRAAYTAQALAEALDIEWIKEPKLAERGFGILEGMQIPKARKYILEKKGEDNWSNFRVQGSESLQDVWQRVSGIEKYFEPFSKTKKKNLAVIGHGCTNALIFAKIVGASVESSRSFRFSNGSITEFELDFDGVFKLLRYADTSHLEALLEKKA